VGDPADPVTRIGPLVSAAQRQRGEHYIAAGRAEGGRIAADGGRPAHLDRGWYIEPTVFADLDPAATLAREEVFGPVLAVLPYDTFDDAIRIANDRGEMGARARVTDRVPAGVVWMRDGWEGLNRLTSGARTVPDAAAAAFPAGAAAYEARVEVGKVVKAS